VNFWTDLWNQGQIIMFTPARDFLLETPWRIIIPNPNVNSVSPKSEDHHFSGVLTIFGFIRPFY
jgi:hypothetical protein